MSSMRSPPPLPVLLYMHTTQTHIRPLLGCLESILNLGSRGGRHTHTHTHIQPPPAKASCCSLSVWEVSKVFRMVSKTTKSLLLLGSRTESLIAGQVMHNSAFYFINILILISFFWHRLLFLSQSLKEVRSVSGELAPSNYFKIELHALRSRSGLCKASWHPAANNWSQSRGYEADLKGETDCKRPWCQC